MAPVRPTRDVRAAKLTLERISKSFLHADSGRDLLVLDAIESEVARGEFLAIVGPSGCGKTTLLHIIAALVRPGSGRVLVDGHVVSEPGPDRVIVFQDAALLPWRSAVRNVSYGLECLGRPDRSALAEAASWLDRVGLHGYAQHYPHQLSEGMKQRVNLARALAVNPDILVMDEPFASLDDDAREAMQRVLLDLWSGSGKTVVFVTHQIAEALFLADRILVLSHRPARVLDTIAVELPRPREDSMRRLAWMGETHDRIRLLLSSSR